MLGTTQFNTPIHSTTDRLFAQPQQYSGFLRAVKPLIDVAKRSNVNEKIYHLTNKTLASTATLLQKFNSSFDLTQNDKNALTTYYRQELHYELSLEQNQLVDSLMKGADFSSMIASSLSKLGYAVKRLDDEILKVQRDDASAILSIPTPFDFKGFDDIFWGEQSISYLNELKKSHHCDAAIYITPGRISMLLRKLSKKLDVFVLSGWEVIRLLHDTQLFDSATFDTLDKAGGQA